MPSENADIARRFEQLADLLEVADENPFRIRAYREAASTIRGHPEPMRALVERGEDLAKLSGIGKASAAKIAQLVTEGRLPAFEKAAAEIGSGIALLLAVPGLGPKRLRTLKEELGTGDAQAIEEAARAGRVRAISGFGAGLEEKILGAVQRGEDPS